MTTTSHFETRPRPLQLLYAPFAGAVLDGEQLMPLAVRFDATAITADGRLIAIDRPAEWIDDTFTSWYVYDLQSLGSDQMRAACELVEYVLQLNAGTVSAESLQLALTVAATCVNGTIQQLQRRLGTWQTMR